MLLFVSLIELSCLFSSSFFRFFFSLYFFLYSNVIIYWKLKTFRNGKEEFKNKYLTRSRKRSDAPSDFWIVLSLLILKRIFHAIEALVKRYCQKFEIFIVSIERAQKRCALFRRIERDSVPQLFSLLSQLTYREMGRWRDKMAQFSRRPRATPELGCTRSHSCVLKPRQGRGENKRQVATTRNLPPYVVAETREWKRETERKRKRV